MRNITLKNFLSTYTAASNVFIDFYWLTDTDNVPSGWYVNGIYHDDGNICTVWIEILTRRAVFWERDPEGGLSTIQVAMPGEY